MFPDVYIVSAARSPIGSFKGQFSTIPLNDLTKCVMKETVQRSGVPVGDIDYVYMGNVLSAGKGQNPARKVAISAGVPLEAPAITVNMLCGSGLKTVSLGFSSIRSGDAKVVLCGGMESMTQAEHTIEMRTGHRLGNGTLKDSLLCDGLIDAMHNVHMGITAEEVAKRYNLSRQEQDEYALRSQQKAALAISSGNFQEEIVGIPNPKAAGEFILKDEFPQPNVTLESLGKLKPAFQRQDGTVTAGNASGINDGAAVVLLVRGDEVAKRNLKPLAKIIGFAEVGIEPMVMGVSPIKAIQKLMDKLNWTRDDVDLYEVNEAFASQSIAVLRELGLEEKKVNINGGAIALGHPIGASGTRVLVTLIYSLRRLGLKRGIASLCIGGGMGIAIGIEIPQ